MKIFPTYPGFHKVQSALAEFSGVLKRAGYGVTIYLEITR